MEPEGLLTWALSPFSDSALRILVLTLASGGLGSVTTAIPPQDEGKEN